MNENERVQQDYVQEIIDLLRSGEDIEQLQEQMCKLEYLMADPDISQAELDKVMNSYGRVQEDFLNKGGYEVEANIDKIAANLKVTELLNQDYSSLSGGQKIIVCLARLLLQKPNFEYFLQSYHDTVYLLLIPKYLQK